jgi:hypothetical protein
MIEKSIGVTTLLLVLGVTGCGPNGGPKPADAGGVDAAADADPKGLARFIGTWNPTSGSVQLVCDGAVSASDITDPDIWVKGTASDLFQTEGCQLEANLSGDVATALPAQTCDTTDQTGAAGTLTFTTYTFTLASSGSTAGESSSGTAVFTASTGTGSCTFTETAAYSKAGS